MNARLADWELDAAIAGERPEWEDTRTPGQIEADLRAAICEVYAGDSQELPRENPEFDSPWWLVAAAVVVVLTCAASAIWPMGWAT
jgi:hypothetical protein